MFLKSEKKYSSLREEFVANLNKRFDEERKKKMDLEKKNKGKEIKRESD